MFADGGGRGRPRDGHAEQIALTRVAAELHQPIQDLRGLDALGRGVQPERVAQADDRFHDPRLFGSIEHLRHEGTVDLDDVEIELAQMVEARIVSAEIVERHAHPDIPQRSKHGLGLMQPLHDRALGDLDHQAMGRKGRPGKQSKDSRGERGIGNLPGREIHRDEEMFGPGFSVADCLLEQVLGHLGDIAGIFGDGNESLGRRARLVPGAANKTSNPTGFDVARSTSG
jgi:hypothetical protein